MDFQWTFNGLPGVVPSPAFSAVLLPWMAVSEKAEGSDNGSPNAEPRSCQHPATSRKKAAKRSASSVKNATRLQVAASIKEH